MRKILLSAIIVCFSLISAAGYGFDLEGRVQEFSLENGMRWLVVERPGAPVFSGAVMVRVGGLDESPGKTGIAHMFEHMAFKGSKRLGTADFEKEDVILKEIEHLGDEREAAERELGPKAGRVAELTEKMVALEKEAKKFRVRNEIWDVMMRNGAEDLNAFTSKDNTAFFASMPNNRLELWARVFAEMIFHPSYREFYTERNVIADERRSLTENNPDGELAERILSAAFKDGPYHWSTIGFMDDINDLTIADARAFHERYYVPSNMVGVIVGNVGVGKVERIVKEAFGKYPKGDVPSTPSSGGMPNSGVVKKIRFNAEPALAIAYHKPTLPDPVEYTFDAIVELMCEGRSSMLKKKFVYDKKIAQNIECTDGYPGSRLDNLFMLWVEPMKGHSASEIAGEISKEFALLRGMPIGDAELERIQNQVLSSLLFALDDNMSLALALARFESSFGDWRILARYPKMIDAVTKEDVMRVAREYLTDDKRIIVERTRSGQ